MNQGNLFTADKTDMMHFEALARKQGFNIIAGIDEAGRGPLAGPVVAAAVILNSDAPINGVNDSKKLSEKRREQLYERIMSEAVSIGIGYGSHELIDRINILQATRKAMLEAVMMLSPAPDCLLIDGITTIESGIFQKTIKQGDSRSISIAAASIVAKVTRDKLMSQYDKDYPQYGFAGHKGYGSASHLSAIRTHGPSPIHRRTFGGVREHLPDY